MGSFLKNLKDALKLQDDEEAFEQFEHEEREKDRKAAGADRPVSVPRAEKPERPRVTSESHSYSDDFRGKLTHSQSNYGTSTYFESRDDKKALRMEKPDGSKVVPLKTTRGGYQVCVMKPKNLDDAQDISDVLLSDCVAIVNLEDNDLAISQRIMDFLSGSVYTINGKLYQISELIFIVAPGAVDVSGDYNDILAQSGFDVPILGNKDF